MFIYDFVAERLKRQIHNDQTTRDLLLTHGSLASLKKVANTKALERAATHYGISVSELRKLCVGNPDLVFGLDIYCSINAGRQSSLDEIAIFKGLDSHLPHIKVQKLPNSGSGSLRITSDSKSIDGVAYNDDLFLLLPAKCCAGNGGHQDNVWKEMSRYAKEFLSLTKQDISQLLPSGLEITDKQKLICALLVDTDNQDQFDKLVKNFASDDVWVVSHIQLQEKLNEYMQQETERPIFYETESLSGGSVPCLV